MLKHHSSQPTLPKQHGATLYVVIVLVMLSMLLALWASRTSIFGEMIVGNDADYQRAFEAAQALLQDAELDIRRENSNGSICTSDGSNPYLCRKGIAPYGMPSEEQDVTLLLANLESISSGPQCRHAVCAKRVGKQDFWNNTDESKGLTLAQMENAGVPSDASKPPIGARYGQYTGATIGATSNSILAYRGDDPLRGGWYWIEIMRYDSQTASSSNLIATETGMSSTQYLPLQLDINIVYRITAVAHGIKPNTQVVLQQTYARNRLKD